MGRKRKGDNTKRLLIDPTGQTEMFEKSYEQEVREEQAREVECLGKKFPNDEARRTYFLDRLREHLLDPEFRKIKGFPIGTDDDILKLSDPPYYTACPNPFISEWIQARPTAGAYHRPPFAADISEGKNDPIYNAHSYHTKVPPRAILRYILHYTSPGDVVLDAFAGTGMTAVAAQLAADKALVEELANEPTASLRANGDSSYSAGPRTAIAIDLSPVGGFIAANLLSPILSSTFESEAERIVSKVEAELPWLYDVAKAGSAKAGKLVYAVWSDYLLCSECGCEIDAWKAVIDRKRQLMRAEFPCPHCNAMLKRRVLDKAMTTSFDPVLQRPIAQPKQLLKWLYYRSGTTRLEREGRPDDTEPCERARKELATLAVPSLSMEHTWQHFRDGNHIKNITHTHHYFTWRSLLGLTRLWETLRQSPYYREMLFVLTGFIDGHANKRNRYIIDKHHPEGTTCGPLSNTLFIPEVQCEVNVFDKWRQTARKQRKAKTSRLSRYAFIQTRSATDTGLPDASIDYIFVDPPFGKNIMYSELNHLYECWLGVRAAPHEEAIVNDKQGKGLLEYTGLMARCFAEFFRVLKPGRWLTLEFHNSRNSVWHAIQEALFQAGFVIADVRVLDKKHGTLHQDSGYTVKQDLIVSAYRPVAEVERQFQLEAGREQAAWDFVRAHLSQLPVFVLREGRAEIIVERQHYMLYDRMVAFHVQRNVTVPMSAGEFYSGVAARFSERDGMYFLPEQAAIYDRKRARVPEVAQLELFITNEAGAIQWLRQQLRNKPYSLPELHPEFLKAIGGWSKHEKPLELGDLLEQNFLQCDGVGEVPSQIHAYLSSNFKDLRGLPKDDRRLQQKAKGRWYVPDANKVGDLEKLREKALLREFDEYVAAGTRTFKVFRIDAMRAGFKRAYDQRNYQMIVELAEKIPEEVLQEDDKLLMYFDVARMRLGTDEGNELF